MTGILWLDVLLVWCAIALLLCALKAWHGLRRYHGRYQINQMLREYERETYDEYRRSRS